MLSAGLAEENSQIELNSLLNNSTYLSKLGCLAIENSGFIKTSQYYQEVDV